MHTYILVLKRIVIFAIWIVASLMIKYRIICAHTQRRMHRIHACMQAHTHAHTQSSCGRWHAQLAVNLLFANNLEVFPYRTPQRPTSRFTWARLTIQLRYVEHQVRANYIITRIFVYVLWHSNSTVMIKYSIVSALIYTHIHCTCKHDLSLRTYYVAPAVPAWLP